MSWKLALAVLATLASGCVAQGPAPPGLTSSQEANWKAINKFLDALQTNDFLVAVTALDPAISFNLHFDTSAVEIGGSYWGTALYTGFLQYGASLQAYSPIDTSPQAGYVRPAAVDDANIYIRGTRSIKFLGSGGALANTTVAAIGAFNDKNLAQSVDVWYDSARFARANCAKDAMTCGSASKLQKLSEPLWGENGVGHVATPFKLLSRDRTSTPFAPTAADQSNLQVLQSYWDHLFVGNLTGASEYLAADVVTYWRGDPELCPMGGVYHGISAWMQWLGGTQSHVTNYGISDFSIRSCVGGDTDGAVCVAVFYERFYTKASPPRPATNMLNFAFYNFNSANEITEVDVHVNSYEYAKLFCGSFLRCA